MTAIAQTNPTRVSNPPPTGWLLLVLHAAGAGFGALLTCVAVFSQVVTGPVPRSVLILAGVIVFLGAFWSYVQQHSKTAAAAEAAVQNWIRSHGVDLEAALRIVQDFAAGLPPTWKTDLATAKTTATQALQVAQDASVKAAAVATPSTDALVSAVVARLMASSQQQGATTTVTPAPPGQAQV